MQIPHKFTPRDYQVPFLRAMDEGIRRAILVWHRRSGKDKTCFNFLVKSAFQRVGVYFYLFPTYAQGKKILWDSVDGQGMKVLEHIPKELIKAKNNTEMKIELVNGSVIQVVGTDNIDSIVGTNPVGCLFSEFSIQDPRAWGFIRPILRENKGWAVFNFTPRGKNHAFDLYEMAKNNSEWFCQKLTIDDTSVLNEEDIDAERDEGMDEELILQEYYCDFNIGIQGSYYSKHVQTAEKEGRIGKVPVDSGVGVETWWDLGVGDATAIWFTQSVGKEIRFVDYYEAQGEGLPHYAQVLQEKGYIYKSHNAPFDIEVKELGTGRSRLETAKSLGIDFRVVKKLGIDDGIHAVRRLFPRMWFDEEKCEAGINAIKNYRKEFDDKRKMFKNHPYHDWSSHCCDALRYFAVGFQETVERAAKPKYKVSNYADPITGY